MVSYQTISEKIKMNEINIRGTLRYDELRFGGLPEITRESAYDKHEPFEFAVVGRTNQQGVVRTKVIPVMGLTKIIDEGTEKPALVIGEYSLEDDGLIASHPTLLEFLSGYRTSERFL